MRLKSMILASTSFFILAEAAPAFAQTDSTAAAQDAAVGAQDATAAGTSTQQAEEDAIVVTGLRRSLETSQRIKRESEGIVDAIVAEDIGKLPDTFASSALQRVAGVAVTRGGGESAGVTVRGLPNLTTTYNGREIFTAEGRYVQIQDFPAGTVAALEVYKSGLAPRSKAASPARSTCADASRSTSTASSFRARSTTCIRSRRSARPPTAIC
ncbi:TonB-dependent receptor plug domain-containing protein [Sphingomonas sp. 7/4-4]|uniref:TonB-dependent receptor plug domain-containing protein n=1 Tax=Sphingomonas sp. 7/4-4 TaxID=3018446 RepID=UPI0022F3DC4C|nr:TonB-dependent receptor plug domain-containing protein [Sphingomonas sp. 7/4-4]WBY07561.1 TonB-dependent receptor plug domain-containing protein [Sphingomonas sp. 7/4-4]